MSTRHNTRQVLTTFILVVAAALAPVTVAQAEGDGEGGNGHESLILKRLLTARWWQWVLEQPEESNPNLDPSGAWAANGQPDRNVFFIAGTFGGAATRAFTVPTGKALFFPLLNVLSFAPIPSPRPWLNGNSIPQLRRDADNIIDSIDTTKLFATLNGVSLLGSDPSDLRIKSTAFLFQTDLFGLGRNKAVSDGYWLYIPPLVPGTYVLHFGGEFPDGNRVDITDTITVQ